MPPLGTPSPAPRRSFRPGAGWILFFLALLALNVFLSMRAAQPASRVRVLPRPGARGARRVDHVEGNDDPGNVHGEADVQGVQAD